MKLPKELQKKKTAEKLTAADKRKIRENYPVHNILCECCEELIPCPICEERDLLRGWNSDNRTLALCYGCGTLFYSDNDEIVSKLTGNRDFWGSQALIHI